MKVGLNKMKPITVWYKINTNDEGEITSKQFNHFEIGWSELDYPRPFSLEFLNQVAWQKEKWEKRFKLLDEYKIVEIS